MRFFRPRTSVPPSGDESASVARLPSTFAEALASANDARVEVRAAAGVVLASTPDLEPVTDVLMRLLLDPDDTFVTSETAQALVERRDVPGMRLIISALARADEENTANWILDMVLYPETLQEHAATTTSLVALTTEPDIATTAKSVLERLEPVSPPSDPEAARRRRQSS
jgi:hypothetical protein